MYTKRDIAYVKRDGGRFTKNGEGGAGAHKLGFGYICIYIQDSVGAGLQRTGCGFMFPRWDGDSESNCTRLH